MKSARFRFAKEARLFCKGFSRKAANNEDIKQLLRSSASIGANYIEANESLSKKDFVHRMKICRKEAKESGYWLSLITSTNPECEEAAKTLAAESVELKKIFSAIIEKIAPS